MNWKRIFSPAFIVAATVLLAMFGSLELLLAKLDAALMKEAVPLRLKLHHLPESFGPYTIHTDPAGNKSKRGPENTPREMIDELGTTDFITWTYLDTTKQPGEPGWLVQLHVAYYTGIVDTVPHIPEHCTIATGAQIDARSHPTIKLSHPTLTKQQDQWWAQSVSLAPLQYRTREQERRFKAMFPYGSKVRLPAVDLAIRQVSFIAPHRSPFCEQYFFVANGQFRSNAMEVRSASFNLTDKFAYYCKVQVTPLKIENNRPVGLSDRKLAVQLTERFLSYALPEIMLCLPDWYEVQDGRYPLQDQP